MVNPVAQAAARIIYPRCRYPKGKVAIGIVEVDGAVPYTVAAKRIIETYNVAFYKPLLLGSGTGTLVFGGSPADVKDATDPAWLMRNDVLGIFYKRKPLIGTQCFENPGDVLVSVIQELSPVEAPPAPMFLTEEALTLCIFETLRAGPYFHAQEFIGRFQGEGELRNIGDINFGSKHRSWFYAGPQGLAYDAKMAAKEYIRALTKAGLAGEYDGSWYLNLKDVHHDLIFILPWANNPNILPFKPAPKPFISPFEERTAAQLSYFFIETQGVAANLQAIDAAAKKAVVISLEPELLGSGTRTAIGMAENEDSINEAVADVLRLNAEKRIGMNFKGESSVLNVFGLHHPKRLQAERMVGLEPASPRFDMTGLSLLIVDTVKRGSIYDAAHVLVDHPDVRVVGVTKEGSEMASLIAAGKLPAVQAAKAAMETRIRAELGKPERCGALYAIADIPQPHEQVLRGLPWQKNKPYIAEPPEGQVLSYPYYKFDPNAGGPPFANVEVRSLAHGLVIADAALREGVVPVSRYSVGASLVNFHFTAETHALLTHVFEWDKLLKVCGDMPYTCAADDGLDRMLLNVAAYPQPGPIWDIIDHQQPVPEEAIRQLGKKDMAIGVITVRGVVPTLYFLDQLKNYAVEADIEKTGGQHITIILKGVLDQVTDAIKGTSVRKGGEGSIVERMLSLHDQFDIRMVEYLKKLKEEERKELAKYDYDAYKMLSGQTRTWAVIGNPHPNLAFFLPRGNRIGL